MYTVQWATRSTSDTLIDFQGWKSSRIKWHIVNKFNSWPSVLSYLVFNHNSHNNHNKTIGQMICYILPPLHMLLKLLYNELYQNAFSVLGKGICTKAGLATIHGSMGHWVRNRHIDWRQWILAAARTHLKANVGKNKKRLIDAAKTLLALCHQRFPFRWNDPITQRVNFDTLPTRLNT